MEAPPTASSYTAREELAHRLSHALGIAGSLVAIPWLALAAQAGGDAARLLGGVVFGLSALLLFTTSVLYHSATDADRRLRLRRLDHCAIYVLIAGTYTPVALGPLRDSGGWILLLVIWALALLGVIAKTTRFGFRFHRSSVLLYLLMGWLVVIAAKPVMRELSGHELGWLAAGGLLYTAGVPFYLWKSRPFAHAIWHLFVLGGVACHFIAVLAMMRPG